MNAVLSDIKPDFEAFLRASGIAYDERKPRPVLRCPNPAHDDEHPSAVLYRDTGRIWCPVCDDSWDVYAVAGLLHGEDEFPRQREIVHRVLGLPTTTPTTLKAPQPRPAAPPVPLSFEAAKKIYAKSVLRARGEKAGWGKLIKVWPYRDAEGRVVAADARFESGDGRKTVITFWTDDGKRVLSTGAPSVLFNLDRIAEHLELPVLVVEGCKTATAGDVLKGFVVTTWPGGSGRADRPDWSVLSDRAVYILPDDDDPGMKAARTIKAALPHAKIVPPLKAARKVKPTGADLVEWVQVATPEEVARHIVESESVEEIALAATVDTLDAWPASLPLVADIRPEPYPIDALPDAIRAAVLEVQGFIQAPIPLVAASAISAVSCAVQGLVDVARTETLKGPASLYMLTVAESGERKSSSDYYFSRAIRAFETSQAEIAAPEVARCRARLEAWESEKAGVNSAISKEAKSGEVSDDLRRRLEDLERNKPQPHLYPRMIRGDSTQEHLSYALASEWPSAGIVSAEGGSVFGSHAMGRESVMRYMATLNGLWSGEVLRVGRRSSESFTVDGARLTVGLQVQPEVLAAFVEANGDLARGSGFLARFLISAPESTQGSRPFKDEPAQWVALDRFGRRVDELLGAVQVDDAGALRLTTIALGVAAKGAWIDFHNDVEAELLKGGELATVRDVASKAADNVARLAALFHVFENGPIGTIDAPAVDAAGRIVAWHLLESKRFFGEKLLSTEQKNAVDLDAWLVEWCREHGTNRVPSAVVGHDGPGKLRKVEARDPVFEVLVALGRARLKTEGRQKWIEVNPALLGDVVTR